MVGVGLFLQCYEQSYKDQFIKSVVIKFNNKEIQTVMSLHQDYIQKYGQKALQVYNQIYKPKQFQLKEIKQVSHTRKRSVENLRSASNKNKSSQGKLKTTRKNSVKNIQQTHAIKQGFSKLNLKSQPLKLGNPALSNRLHLVIPSPSMRQSPFISPYKNSLSKSRSSKRKSRTKRFKHDSSTRKPLQNTVNALKQQLNLNNKSKTKVRNHKGQNTSNSISPNKSSIEISNILKDSIECLDGIQQILMQSQKIPEVVGVLKIALNKVLKKTKYFHQKWKQSQHQCNIYKKEVQLINNRIQQNNSRKNHKLICQKQVQNNHIQNVSDKFNRINLKGKNQNWQNQINEQVILLTNQNRQYSLKIQELSAELQYYKSRQTQLFGMFNQFRTSQEEPSKGNYMATSHFMNQDKTEKSSNIDHQKQTRMKIVAQGTKLGFTQHQNQRKFTGEYSSYPFQQRFTIGKDSQKHELSQYSQN